VIDNLTMQQQVQQGPVPGPPVGVPEGVVTEATRGAFPLSVTTGEDGMVQLDLVGSDPGNPRGYVDGQVYGVRYDWNGVDRSAFKDEPMNLISVLVWDAYELDGKPTWIEHVQPIFQQYANLYPVMRRILDLDDYASVKRNVVALQFNFDLRVEDPNYMPVVRDLSTAKRTMIKTWLADPAYMRIDSVADLQRALQQAIELEHSTIPPYLTALFSIKDGRNREVAEIIESIVLEEMLHMALACNLLNAVGGAPAIDTAGFVPKYPTTMPGGLHPGLVVSLKKASIEHIRDVFMTIEEPEETIDPDVHYGLTIGWFYAQIEAALERLDTQPGVNLFSGDPKRQVSGWDPPRTTELFAVTNLETARQAIREIRDQGEGASPIDPDVGPGQELAHYYKFEEIVRGRRLVVHEGGYDFTGAEIAFDPDGVWPMVDNPSTASLPSPSLARVRSEEFNEQYAALLALLHRTFNGETDLIGPAINLMWSLEVAGKGLVQTPIYPDSAVTAGPSFEYPGASPAEEPKASPNQRFKPATMKGQPVTR
jgi:rubrerythrin